jgi:AAA+ ATPase superfamily predicted ATPase
MLTVPVSKSEFIGREAILNLLDKRVKAFKKGYRQNVALLGPEMIGKTSLVSQFISKLEHDENILPIYVFSMQEPLSIFAFRFMRAVLYYTLKNNKKYFKETYTTADLPTLKNEARSLCPAVVDYIQKVEKLLEYKRASQALAALFDLLSELKNELRKPVLLILDEFQFVMSTNVKRPYLLLGEHIISQKDVMYIITSSEVRLGKEILAHDLSLLFGNFEHIMVKPFNYEESREFLNQRLKWINIKQVHKKFIITITGGHPFYIELLCRRLRSIVQEYKIGQVPKNILIKAIAEELFYPSSFIYQYMDRLLHRLFYSSSRWIYLNILLAISSGKRKVGEIAKFIHISATSVSRYLKKLVNTGLVKKYGSVYLVIEPMLPLWLKLAYQKISLSLDIDYIIYEQKVNQELEALINVFEEEETKTLAERLRTLFSSFKNDIVRLNGHRFKLFHFSEVEHRVADGIELPIVARVHNRYWIPHVAEEKVSEKDIRAIIEKLKKLRYRISCKPLICLGGIETDAKLAAQEAGLTIWDLEDINILLNTYNLCPLAV